MLRVSRGLLFAGLLAALLFPLAGCNNTPIVPAMAIAWDALDEGGATPAAARSAVVSLKRDGDLYPRVAWIAPRPATAGAVTEHYAAPEKIYPDTYTLRVEFRAEANGTGALLATVCMPVSVSTEAPELPAVTTVQAITSVDIPLRQSIVKEQRKLLSAFARNARGEVVAIAPDAQVWQVHNGHDRLQFLPASADFAPRAQGLATGDVLLTVMLAGHISDPTEVRVKSGYVLKPEGNTVMKDGLSLSVPAGTVPEDFVIAISGSDLSYEISPDISFKTPADLTIYYSDSDIPPGVNEYDLRLTGPGIVGLPWISTLSNCATARIDEFGEYTITAE